LHRQVSEHTLIRANRLVALLSKMFSLAVEAEWISANPARGIKKNLEQPRERFLTEEETARLVSTLDEFGDWQAVDCIRLLLLTGARRSEALGSRWSEFDLAAGVWVKPSPRTKNGRVHRIPLSTAATQLLQRMKSEASSGEQYLFPARSSRRGPFRPEITREWRAVCRLAGIPGLRLHDLRHSFASVLASNGASLLLIGALLGHRQPSTTARYAHLADSSLRAATETAGNVIRLQR
jgi:integrase